MRIRSFANLCCVCCLALLIVGCSGKKKAEPASGHVDQPAVSFFRVNPETSGSVTGTIRYTGKRPARELIDMSEDPACVEAHHGKAYDESLVVSSTGSLANAFIYVKKGLEGKRFAVPTTPVIIDQRGCWFRPRVMGIQVDQPLQIINSDPVTHNIHPMSEINREWNHSQGPGDSPLNRKFVKPEIMIPIKCNIHSWMHAFIGVLNHPYFSVSKEDGSFAIKNLPPGTYTIGVWQEKLGTQEQQVTITPRRETVSNFTFKGK